MDPGMDLGIFKYFRPYSEFTNKLNPIMFNCAQQKYKISPDSKVTNTGKETIGIRYENLLKAIPVELP